MADQWVEENFKEIAFDDGMNTWSLAKNHFVSFKDQHLVKYSKSEGILKIWINFVREIDQALSNAVEFLMPFSKVMAENINFKLGNSIITKSNFDSKHIKCHKNIRVKSSDNQDYLSPKIDDKPLKSSFSNLTSVNILYDKTSDNSTSDDLIWTWEGSELSENERRMAKISPESITNNEGFLVYTFNDEADDEFECHKDQFCSSKSKKYVKCIVDYIKFKNIYSNSRICSKSDWNCIEAMRILNKIRTIQKKVCQDLAT